MSREVAVSLLKTTRALERVARQLTLTTRALRTSIREGARLKVENERLRAKVLAEQIRTKRTWDERLAAVQEARKVATEEERKACSARVAQQACETEERWSYSGADVRELLARLAAEIARRSES